MVRNLRTGNLLVLVMYEMVKVGKIYQEIEILTHPGRSSTHQGELGMWTFLALNLIEMLIQYKCITTMVYFILQVAKAVSSSLDTCVNCLPGQRDVDIAIRQITETSQTLSSQKVLV